MYLNPKTNAIHWCCANAKALYPKTINFEAALNSFCIYELCNGGNGQFNHYIHEIKYCPCCGKECKPRRTKLMSKPYDPEKMDLELLKKQGKIKLK